MIAIANYLYLIMIAFLLQTMNNTAKPIHQQKAVILMAFESDEL